MTSRQLAELGVVVVAVVAAYVLFALEVALWLGRRFRELYPTEEDDDDAT